MQTPPSLFDADLLARRRARADAGDRVPISCMKPWRTK